MDALVVFPAAGSSSCSPPSAASFFSAAERLPVRGSTPPVIELVSCEVPEQWLFNDDLDLDDNYNYQPAWAGSAAAAAGGLPAMAMTTEPCAPAVEMTKRSRRGRKPGPRSDAPTVSHVEAERHRRERLNRRFCDLRAAVPTVSRMDRASLLSDAVSYISQLTARLARLEREAAAMARQKAQAAESARQKAPAVREEEEEERLEVRMVGAEREAAALRFVTASSMASAVPARLMAALRALDLPVQHACVSRVHGGGAPTVVQDVVVDVPDAGMRDEGRLRTALLRRLHAAAGDA
ncbi:transcription factor bHLH14 [Brachypodium distachyon]|uniref:Transcription factor n=1 Tax=Brachypodium distachyon TaxID=15368 RepID=I1I961_BRADI|nr:transcription factor bHLH14 [Brachypodium distachyon]KQJ99241.1 hypothetical protein BRADI_3g41930v3 [Brachypodium distachyon]|eukprot:XP_003572475.1 transcription factor bHLH14 [Brachypodium distachyon]